MQIHEITLAKKQQVDEGILDAARAAAGKVGGMVNQVKSNSRQASLNKQTEKVAGKAYDAWNSYARQLEQFAASKGPEALKAFQNRSDGMYQKSLMAFVQKNLLQGNQIGKLINKDDIIRLVKQLSVPKPAPAPAPAQQGAQQQPPVQSAALAQAQPVVAQMPAGTPRQGAQQAAGAMKPNQARAQSTAAPATTPQGQAPAQTLGRVQSTPAGASRPVAPGQAPQANTAQKKKPVSAPDRTVQEAAALPNEKELFKQLVHASALAMPDISANQTTTKKDKTVPPVGTDTPATAEPAAKPTPVAGPGPGDQEDTGAYVAPGKRLKLPIEPNNPNQQPSYYYKTSNNVWTTEQGKPVALKSYPTLEKLADSGAAREEDDPDYVTPAEVKPTTTRKNNGR